MKMKFLFYLGLLGVGCLLSLGCYSGSYRYYDDCYTINTIYSQHCNRYNKNYGYQGQLYPYHRNNPYYYGNGGYKHNPFHISPGRFHNFGRPSKWKF
ncbi:hypothetical protein DPV73_14410 [Leptospira mayottensis]|nr:hypothetical protein DPV73_14410 [Leptospira mayottensis]